MHGRLDDSDKVHTGALLKWTDDTGKEQTSYSAEFDRRNAEKKWARVLAVKPKADAVMADLREKAATSQAHAAALLIAETALRPGSTSAVGKTGHYGAISMEARHVTFDGDKARIEYVGKAGKVNKATVDDPVLVTALRVAVEGKQPNERVFTVGREAVADALPSGIKLKDFRTLQNS